MRRPYLIIGNSAAAIGGINGIRSVDSDRPITLIAKERDLVYARPLIPYWLAGKVADDDMYSVPRDFYDTSNIELMLGAEAVQVQASARRVVLADGRLLEFDNLLVAGGGAAIVPTELDISGTVGVGTFTCWDDARRVKAWIDSGNVRIAVVVGGGFIGIKTVEALTGLGIASTIVELSDHIMPAAFDAVAAAMATRSLQDNGVRVCCGVSIKALAREDDRIRSVTLSDGTSMACDLLIFAIGVAPNTDFLSGSGLAVDSGVQVDDHMRTSEDGIYAAGDIAQSLDRVTGTSRPIPILKNAKRQGHVAGVNMAGGDEAFQGSVAMNATDVFGLPCISIGLANPPDEGDFEYAYAGNVEAGTYKRLVLQDNRLLVGAICIGDVARAGVLRHLIEEHIDVTSCHGQLLADDFPLDVLPTGYWQRGDITWRL